MAGWGTYTQYSDDCLDAQPLSLAVSRGIELYNTKRPSASLVTIRIIHTCICVVHILVTTIYYSRAGFISLRASSCGTTIRGQHLFEERCPIWGMSTTCLLCCKNDKEAWKHSLLFYIWQNSKACEWCNLSLWTTSLICRKPSFFTCCMEVVLCHQVILLSFGLVPTAIPQYMTSNTAVLPDSYGSYQ